MIFVDTSAWFAMVIPSDVDHNAAFTWWDANTEPLITTDYVVDETLTLLLVRGEPRRARMLGDQFFAGTLASIYYLSDADILEAWMTFRSFVDKQWSFTDCTSKHVIEKLGIARAFAFDQHFRQFGSVIIEPQQSSRL